LAVALLVAPVLVVEVLPFPLLLLEPPEPGVLPGPPAPPDDPESFREVFDVLRAMIMVLLA
jgi:hypothetical protein